MVDDEEMDGEDVVEDEDSEYKYVCSECGKGFNHRGALNLHIVAAHKRKGKKAGEFKYGKIEPDTPLPQPDDIRYPEDTILFSGPTSQEYERTQNLKKILDVIPNGLLHKNYKDYIVKMWGINQNLRKDSREFFSFLMELAPLYKNKNLAYRIVESVFAEPHHEQSYPGYIPRFGTTNEPYSNYRFVQGEHRDVTGITPRRYEREKVYTKEEVEEMIRHKQELFQKDLEIMQLKEMVRELTGKINDLMIQQQIQKPVENKPDPQILQVLEMYKQQIDMMQQQMARMQEIIKDERHKQEVEMIKQSFQQQIDILQRKLEEREREYGIKSEILSEVQKLIPPPVTSTISDEAKVMIEELRAKTTALTHALDKLERVSLTALKAVQPIPNVNTKPVSKDEIKKLAEELPPDAIEE